MLSKRRIWFYNRAIVFVELVFGFPVHSQQREFNQDVVAWSFSPSSLPSTTSLSMPSPSSECLQRAATTSNEIKLAVMFQSQ